MDLLAKLQEDMKIAMKTGQKDRLTVIRMLISDVKNIDLLPNKPTPQQAVEAYNKKLKKSVEEYEKIGRTEEVAKLKSEVAIVEEYLPKKATKEQTEAMIDAFLAQNAFTEKDVGKAMGAFLKQHGQEVDGAIVNPILRAKLAGK